MEEEENGLCKKEVERLLAAISFHIIQAVPFVYGLNHLNIAQKGA